MQGMDATINQIMFMKNLGLVGGLLLVVRHGAGKLSLDAWVGGASGKFSHA